MLTISGKEAIHHVPIDDIFVLDFDMNVVEKVVICIKMARLTSIRKKLTTKKNGRKFMRIIFLI